MSENFTYKSRKALKIVGASGQGINTVGEVVGKAIKRSGFGIIAYREYPSLIKGGHATYQIDWSTDRILATTTQIDLLVVLNRQATNWHIDELKQNAVIVHDIPNPRISQSEFLQLAAKNAKLVYIPALELAEKVGGNELTTNIVTLGKIWQLLDLPAEKIVEVVTEKFKSKPKFLQIDLDCLDQGLKYTELRLPEFSRRTIKPDEVDEEQKTSLHLDSQDELDEITSYWKLEPNIDKFSQDYLITGNEAYALGALNAGVQIHFAYPMTPSSSIMSYLAEVAEEAGIVVKQVEGEITAAAMAIGANYMGTRALTATSGGGFDLMTEHISLAAILEVPFVCVLAQRPGPATGLPTWTSQGDLLLASFAGHGEYPRCVIASRDVESCFQDIQRAFNIAEKYQIPVFVLTDKHLAETLFATPDFDQDTVQIDRGELITDERVLLGLQSTDRYKMTESGISPRWVPGSSPADYNANSDEHDEEGNVVEDADKARAMLDKRMRKLPVLAKNLPTPDLIYNNLQLDQAKGIVRIIGWGSTYGITNDLGQYLARKQIKLDYLDIKYIQPFPKAAVEDFFAHSQKVLLLENNQTGQLGKIIRMETGLVPAHTELKYDGRPFFLEEIIAAIETNKLIDNLAN